MATYSPQGQAALDTKIQWLREAKAAFQALPQIVRDNSLAATETTVREGARGAQARLLASPSIVTRNLFNSVSWSITKTNGRGRFGITNHSFGGRDQPSTRAHFIEFGTQHAPAEPFMIPAAESQKEPYLARMKAAGKGIERDAAAIGMRAL